MTDPVYPAPVTKVAKVQYAKTHLSALLAEVESGAEIVIARGQTPVAKIVPLQPRGARDLGFLDLHVADEVFFDPLSDEELTAWEGR
jgi:antitoxin (DNA-binding transcriptional repressor) of toxin-antitoxin stability system